MTDLISLWSLSCLTLTITPRWFHPCLHRLPWSLGCGQADQGLHCWGETGDHGHEYNFSPFQWMLLLLLLLVSESIGTVVMLLYREPALHLIQVMFYFHSCFCSGYWWCGFCTGVPSRPTEDRVWREQRLHNGLTLCTTKGLVMLERLGHRCTIFLSHLDLEIWIINTEIQMTIYKDHQLGI